MIRTGVRTVLSGAFFSVHRPGSGLRVILFYHSVGSASPLSESPEAFRRQVQYVARWFHVVRLSEFLPAAAALPERNIACITFDDGFADNATIARDVLETAGVPGTFFVVSGLLGRDFATSGGAFSLMSPDQVKALGRAGHEIGSHTVTHPQLPDMDPGDARREVADSKRHLEDLLGTPITSFAYPKGRVDGRVRQYVHDAGYRQAVSARRAFVEPPVDALVLPRLAIKDYIRLILRRRRS